MSGPMTVAAVVAPADDLPSDMRVPLELTSERRFASGVVLVRYRILQA